MSSRLPGLVRLPAAQQRGIAADYAALRSEGERLVQLWSSDRWTDFNEHDPGITILEALCFALTELGYRTDVPIEDLIALPPGTADAEPLLIPPAWLLPTPPVTEGDFRKLLIDRVHGLGNAWLDPASPGLHHLRLYRRPRLPGLIEPADGESDDRLRRRARRAFHRHRPLGEDLASAKLLRPVPVVPRATVCIEDGVEPEAVMAEIL